MQRLSSFIGDSRDVGIELNAQVKLLAQVRVPDRNAVSVPNDCENEIKRHDGADMKCMSTAC